MDVVTTQVQGRRKYTSEAQEETKNAYTQNYVSKFISNYSVLFFKIKVLLVVFLRDLRYCPK